MSEPKFTPRPGILDLNGPVHFFHFDERFCGSTKPGRRVSPTDADVTCEACKGNVTAAVREFVKSLGGSPRTSKDRRDRRVYAKAKKP